MAVFRVLKDSFFGNLRPLDKAYICKGKLLNIWPVACGDCNGCILEVQALQGAAYDIKRSGLCFVDHPAIANIMLLTGVMNRTMIPFIEENWCLMPSPKAFVMVGECALQKSLFEENYSVLKKNLGGDEYVVDVEGCPPSPQQILKELVSLLAPSLVHPPQ